MYKAILEIGGYKIGEKVPTEKAEVWLKMYSVPHVKKVDEESEESFEDKKLETSKKESSKNVMLDDYLGRNTNVVKKNIEEDDLSQKQLEGLLKLEESDKKRKVVIQALEERLN